ncbi:MAG: T9SS type A sorting domain-containing protein [Bacteroidia bacterium]
MKKIAIILSIISMSAHSQHRDNIWMMGIYAAFIPYSNYYYMDFTNGNPDTVVQYRKMPMYITNASICDTAGNLLFYTNGEWIANADGDTLLNSQNFNPGYYTQYYSPVGLGFSQAALFLPFSDTSQFYYVVSESAEEFINKDSVLDAQPFYLTYSIIDATLDSGRGGGLPNAKNINIINDTLLLGRITACKHANGRDWWVVVHKYYSDVYYKLLFTESGVYGPYTQQIGSLFPAKILTPFGYDDFDIAGMACFSPDGSKYATVGPSRIMEVLDFDRCTGMFSNAQTVNIPINPGYNWALGCSFSPNSRFLYANTYMRGYQYDTYAANIDSSGILVAVYDSFVDPFQTYFFINQLGPDGKIYLSTWGGNRSLHVIEYPDSLGASCNFNQHSYGLPHNNIGNTTVPNLPNYRLGRLVGSACDTLTNLTYTPQPPKGGVRVMPNPNNGNFIVSYELPQNTSGKLEIFDINGRAVYSQNLPQWSTLQFISLPKLSNGVYQCIITSGNYVTQKKLVVIH